MQHFTTIIPTMKELEQWMFREMQESVRQRDEDSAGDVGSDHP